MGRMYINQLRKKLRIDKKDILFTEDGKIIEDNTLVAITIMIAESKSEEKEAMVNLVMNFLD